MGETQGGVKIEEFKPHQERVVNRRGNTVDIRLPEGRSTIIYGVHLFPTKPEQLPKDLDGLVLETGNIPYLQTGVTTLVEVMKHPQYSELYPIIKEAKIPLFFADLEIREEWKGLSSLVDPAIQGLEAAAAVALADKSMSDVKSKKLTRRGFLKAGASAAATLWLSSPGVVSLLNALSAETRAGQNILVPLKKGVDALHPELNVFTLSLRNAVIAYKEKWVMKQMGNNPHIGTIIGASHVELEEAMNKDSDELLSYIRRAKPIWERLIVPESLYTVKKQFVDNRAVTPEEMVVPELKQLVEE